MRRPRVIRYETTWAMIGCGLGMIGGLISEFYIGRPSMLVALAGVFVGGCLGALFELVRYLWRIFRERSRQH